MEGLNEEECQLCPFTTQYRWEGKQESILPVQPFTASPENPLLHLHTPGVVDKSQME